MPIEPTALLGLAALGAAIWWLARRSPASGRGGRRADIDHDVLEEAEDEVRDLDAFTSPDEADEQLPDWGPGAPRG